MIEQLADLPPGVIGMRVGGKLTQQDYKDVITPMVEAAVRENGNVRCLVEIDDDFSGVTPAALADDIRLALHVFGAFDAVAIVTDIAWIASAKQWAGFFVPFAMRSFPAGDRAAAAEWLAGLADTAGLTATLDSDSGVLTVEITESLHIEDFAKLSAVVDPWVSEHDDLAGLVLHVRGFPGWASLGAIVRHIRFVIGHHGKVGRIALATDTPGADTVATVAGYLVHPQVQAFPYADLSAATKWAAG